MNLKIMFDTLWLINLIQHFQALTVINIFNLNNFNRN